MTRSLLWIPPDDTRYVWGVSLVRALEWTLLTRKTLEAMARATDAAEAMEELAETSYAAHMSPSQPVADFEAVLHRVLDETYRLFRRLIMRADLERAVLGLHDFHNLKALLKASLAHEEPVGLVPFGLVDVGVMRAAVEGGDIRGLPPDFAPLVQEAKAAYELTGDPQLVEAIIDTAALSMRVNTMAHCGAPVLEDYAVMLADTTNLRTGFRLARMETNHSLLERAFVPGGLVSLETLASATGKGAAALVEVYASTPYAKAAREGFSYLQERRSYAVLDREVENLLVSKLRETRYVFFSPAPIVTFTLAREHEVSMVRLVMVAKVNRIPSDLIVARLSLLYG